MSKPYIDREATEVVRRIEERCFELWTDGHRDVETVASRLEDEEDTNEALLHSVIEELLRGFAR